MLCPLKQYLLVALGDLRNVIYTVNGLPADYSGHLTIVMNDRDPHVTFRNMLLLNLMGSITDTQIAAELALHMWYSVCIPVEYRTAASLLATGLFSSVADDGHFRKNFTQNSKISGQITQNVLHAFATTMVNPTFRMHDAAREYERV